MRYSRESDAVRTPPSSSVSRTKASALRFSVPCETIESGPRTGAGADSRYLENEVFEDV